MWPFIIVIALIVNLAIGHLWRAVVVTTIATALTVYGFVALFNDDLFYMDREVFEVLITGMAASAAISLAFGLTRRMILRRKASSQSGVSTP